MTKQKKTDLFEVLKFTPRDYTIRMYGYGGEVVMGTVDKKVYEYFEANEIDLEDYVCDWDNETEVPEHLQPFPPGSWYECDDIVHESGIEMSNACMVEIDDENGNTIWSSSLDPSDLETHGVAVNELGEYYASEQEKGTVVFYGQSFEKGSFWEGPLSLEQPFNASKLRFNYVDVEGWMVNCGVDYDGEELYSDDYSTTGKSSEYQFLFGDNDSLIAIVAHETGTDDPIDFPPALEVSEEDKADPRGWPF